MQRGALAVLMKEVLAIVWCGAARCSAEESRGSDELREGQTQKEAER